MKLFILAASLLLAAPASAQSIYPNLFGARYCELRRLGVDPTQARDIAIKENWSSSRVPTYVQWQGQRVSLDILDASHYIVSNCPE